MDWLELLLGFLIANLLGYGGGPSSIPLMYEEIVPHYHWLSDAEFSNMLALGNALPGPIATKIAAYVGFEVGGWGGLGLALLATVLPSAAGLILLLRLLAKYRQSNVVKGMTLLVQPVIAIMMVTLTWQVAKEPLTAIGIWQTMAIAAIAFWAMERRKIHPALIIVAAFIYGGVVLQHYV
ncbi:putative chromate transport protein [compost metagenome]|jgi:chromate transporter|uniref:Chromate transporter n=1 Tax=Paenibacillus timonensis TaxID=225915 RepID=A0ABW3S543_9BACL|nr:MULTISPECIES: chromate transporter [Paenibacillus]MCH1639480.1 chromate transporter [Paenibacillus timonensis]MDU2239754.1 chromate transporter [Paenibacillus sp.]